MIIGTVNNSIVTKVPLVKIIYMNTIIMIMN
jgi:hypothetical protein